MSTFVPTRLLVTGGAGFIGSAVVRRVLTNMPVDAKIVVLDLLTYAGHRVNLAECEADPRFVFVHGDICDRALVEELFTTHAIDSVLEQTPLVGPCQATGLAWP